MDRHAVRPVREPGREALDRGLVEDVGKYVETVRGATSAASAFEGIVVAWNPSRLGTSRSGSYPGR